MNQKEQFKDIYKEVISRISAYSKERYGDYYRVDNFRYDFNETVYFSASPSSSGMGIGGTLTLSELFGSLESLKEKGRADKVAEEEKRKNSRLEILRNDPKVKEYIEEERKSARYGFYNFQTPFGIDSSLPLYFT